MKRMTIITVFIFSVLYAYGASPFTLSFKTSDTGNNENILAVYIRTAAGAYVDTIGVYGSKNKYIGELGAWRIHSGITSYSQVPADALMGATRSSYYIPSPIVWTWDLKDHNGNLVPDGNYTIYMCSAHKGKDSDYNFSFVKDGNAGTRTVANGENFTDISIVYDPPPPPNTAPVAQAQNVLTGDGIPLAITLNAPDAEGDPVTYNILSLPASGHLLGTPPNLTYVPVKASGPVSFTFNATDGVLTGNTAKVSVMVLFTDSNGNGMPNSWESTYSVTNAAADPDDDGATNYEEYMAGTNPTNSASVFAANPPQLAGGSDVVLQWSSAAYHYYYIQSSTNLTSGWDTIRSNNVATSPVNSYTGTVNSAGPTYYRLGLEP